MPFVPLRQRKPIPLVLDADKEVLVAKQRERDQAAIARHLGEAPGASGYRFANHPQTFGYVRGPDVPFSNAHAPWRPPETDPSGPAGLRDEEHAKYGANFEAAHGMRKVRSTPALQSPSAANVMEACHPLSTELRRWEKLGSTTKRCDLQGQDVEFEFPRKQQPTAQVSEPKSAPPRQGLVMFPKYMLINNCHLKTRDLQRFHREREEEVARSREVAARALLEGSPTATMHADTQNAMRTTLGSMPNLEASWGAPKLREAAVGGSHFAGSALPHGRAQRTSNPFRTG
mmetsp:Transcript_44397/g.128339  ORF Transcript_44397/g.128339 Transcript_44397/m.128339 type:complete len:287 (-) Transcript_44397:144-1004(-)